MDTVSGLQLSFGCDIFYVPVAGESPWKMYWRLWKDMKAVKGDWK